MRTFTRHNPWCELRRKFSSPVLIMLRTKRDRLFYAPKNRKGRNPLFFSVASEPCSVSGADDPPITSMELLTQNHIFTIVSAVFRLIKSQPGDMEPSVRAYQVSLTDCYCVTRKVVFCPLVSYTITLVCMMYGIVFCR